MKSNLLLSELCVQAAPLQFLDIQLRLNLTTLCKVLFIISLFDVHSYYRVFPFAELYTCQCHVRFFQGEALIDVSH